jgi:hypothetical protein
LVQVIVEQAMKGQQGTSSDVQEPPLEVRHPRQTHILPTHLVSRWLIVTLINSLPGDMCLLCVGEWWQVDMDMDAVVQLAATNPSKIPPLPPRLVRPSTRF